MMIEQLFLGIMAFVVGACIGSALANLAWSWPVRLSGLGMRRSVCESCGTILGMIDLTPIVGWFIRRGHCAHCGIKIPAYYWQIEFAAGLTSMTAIIVLGPVHGLIGALVGFVLLLLARIDLDHMILPDVLTLPLLGLGLIACFWPEWPGALPFNAWIGAIVGYALLAGIDWLYVNIKGRHGLGRGDAKLFAAAGAWVGWSGLPNILVLAAGGTLVVALLSGQKLKSTKPIPFGPALAAAMWLQVLWSWPILN